MDTERKFIHCLPLHAHIVNLDLCIWHHTDVTGASDWGRVKTDHTLYLLPHIVSTQDATSILYAIAGYALHWVTKARPHHALTPLSFSRQ